MAAVALPSPPKQLALLFNVGAASARAVGAVIVTEAVAVHECASVTVTVYVPAVKLGLVGLVVETKEVPPFDQA